MVSVPVSGKVVVVLAATCTTGYKETTGALC